MKKYLRSLTFSAVLAALLLTLTACDGTTVSAFQVDKANTQTVSATLAQRQPTPTDIAYSLERYNLTRRAYWVNGMREKARALPCPIADVPLGYCVLLTNSGSVVGRFEVDGKVTSLNSYLTPDSEYYEYSGKEYKVKNNWLADVDGSYGENDTGIFFFTPDGRYIEWNGGYLYSDIPFIIENPVITYEGVGAQ